LSSCGGSDNAPAVPDQSTSSQKTASSTTAATPEQPSSSPAPKQTAGGALVMPAIKLKTPSGKAPAVVLLPNTNNRAAADSEARKLAQLGIAAVVVASP